MLDFVYIMTSSIEDLEIEEFPTKEFSNTDTKLLVLRALFVDTDDVDVGDVFTIDTVFMSSFFLYGSSCRRITSTDKLLSSSSTSNFFFFEDIRRKIEHFVYHYSSLFHQSLLLMILYAFCTPLHPQP